MKIEGDILCINYYYPPIRSGGVLRNYYFSREFSKIFSQVHVITTSNVDVMENEDMELDENILIYKAKTRDFRSIKKASNHISEETKKSSLFNFLIKLKKSLPFHFYIGEGGQKYIKSSYKRAIKIIEENNIKVIYSSFMPYADHKIAARIKNKFPDIKWIADFRDLQIEPIYQNVYFPAWNKVQERRILRNADVISTISKGLANNMDYLARPILSIPRGIEYQSDPGIKSNQFTISYTGNLYQHYRDGEFFVRVFSDFIKENNLDSQDIQLVYAGRDGRQWNDWIGNYNLSKYFKNRGFVSRNDAREIQRNTHINLLLTSSSEEHQGVLTGKLFEYLETPNPILNLINGVKDQEFELLFNKLQAGKIFYPDQDAQLKEYLLSEYQKHIESISPELSADAEKEREDFSWNAQVKKMLHEAKV